MGITRGGARLLLEESKKRQFSGSVLQLGRQDIYFSMDDLRGWAQTHDVKLSPVPEVRIVKNPWIGRDCIDDNTFFTALGFNEVHSCDHSEYEGATHVFDLNLDVPEKYHGSYDVIFDGGTLEHVFHVPNVLKNIYKLLKPGGRIIHAAPTSNFADHGFYMFSPTFFFDYYGTNGYQIDTAQLFEFTIKANSPWRIYDCSPGLLAPLSVGGLNQNLWGTYFVASKTSSSTYDKIPQQGFYTKLWQDGHKTDSLPLTDSQELTQKTPSRIRYIAKKILGPNGAHIVKGMLGIHLAKKLLKKKSSKFTPSDKFAPIPERLNSRAMY
jgi:SAM-dependent methyltransferase